MAQDGWGLRDIQERCREYREELAEQPELCTAEELAAYWPGGEENPGTGRGAWFYCYGNMLRFLGRSELQDREADESKGEQAAIEAARELPLAVDLQDQPGKTISVYPKSFDALSLIDELDLGGRWLGARVVALEQEDSAGAVMAAQDGKRGVTEIAELIAWIVTTPGPGTPYPAESEPPPIPDHIRALSPIDLVRIAAAHLQVNRTRIALIVSLLQGRGERNERVSWSTIAAHAADNLGQPIEHLLKNRSHGAWIAQFVLKCRAQMEEAERMERRNEPVVTEMVG